MTWPCLTSTVIPFAAFSVQVDIVSSAQAFDARATFTLGQGGTFDLATDAVTIQLSHPPHTASVTIPKGSFQQVQGRYIFAGVINGMPVEAAIAPLGGRNYAFAIGAAGVPNLPAANPVMVTLTIGNNSGTATVTANIQ